MTRGRSERFSLKMVLNTAANTVMYPATRFNKGHGYRSSASRATVAVLRRPLTASLTSTGRADVSVPIWSIFSSPVAGDQNRQGGIYVPMVTDTKDDGMVGP